MPKYNVICEEKTVWEGTIEADSYEEALSLAKEETIKTSVFMSEKKIPLKCMKVERAVNEDPFWDNYKVITKAREER